MRQKAMNAHVLLWVACAAHPCCATVSYDSRSIERERERAEMKLICVLVVLSLAMCVQSLPMTLLRKSTPLKFGDIWSNCCELTLETGWIVTRDRFFYST